MTPSTAVTKQSEDTKALAPVNEPGVSGTYDSDDFVTPICSIVQPSSGSERGEPGKFWFPDGFTAEKLTEIIVLAFSGTRTLWAPKGEGDSVPVCRSPNRRDGMTTRPSLVIGEKEAKAQGMKDGSMVYIPCEVCPHFRDDKFGSDNWLCKPGYTLLLFEEERGPFMFFVKGSAINPVKRTIVSPALMRIRQGQPAAPWRWTHDFSLHMTENDKGKFYVPDIKQSGDVEDAEAYLGMSQEMAGIIERQMEASVIDEDEELRQATFVEAEEPGE
jgi:hypothetical protein